MEKNWKLCETLVVGIIGINEVHLADFSQKSYVKEIDKLIGKEGGSKLTLENNNFSVRICGVNIMINHPELPYECSLQNQADLEDIMRIISLTKTENGVFEGNNWSFLVDSHKNFLPAKEGIKLYDDAEIKMIRNFSLTGASKTSKWIPGYSYFSEDITYHYLGSICTWRNKESLAKSTYGPQIVDKTLHMVLSSEDFNPKKGQTYNITEIICDNFDKIQFLKQKSNMVKSQAAFAKDDFIVYVPLIESILEKWVTENRSTYSEYSSLIMFTKGLDKFFKILEFSTTGEAINLSQKSKELIESVVKDQMRFELTKKYNSRKHNFADRNKLKEVIKEFFFNSISGDIYNQEEYYGSILTAYGIDYDSIAQEVTDTFDQLSLADTWEHYIQNIVNVPGNPGELTDFFLDNSIEKHRNYSYYYGSGKSDFSDKEKEVFDNIMNFCRETSKNLNEYMIRNAGTISKPKYIEVFTITLDTIYRMYGKDVPENVQEVLIKGKFNKVTIKKDLQ